MLTFILETNFFMIFIFFLQDQEIEEMDLEGIYEDLNLDSLIGGLDFFFIYF